MNLTTISRIGGWSRRLAARAWDRLRPHTSGVGEIAGIAADACRTRRELIVENAMLRHQINILRRSVKRPKMGVIDRLKLLLGATLLPAWRKAVTIVQPETLLRWHRSGFRLFCRAKARPRNGSPLAPETIELIRDMASRGRLWGAERIRGELLKLGIKVSKRTIQKYMRSTRTKGGDGQNWKTFLKNHAEATWACDFVQTHIASRRVVHIAATRSPTQEWTAQQLRNATMDGDAPKFIIRDRDDKFGSAFDIVATGAGARVVKIAVRAPNMNAVAERFAGSLRRELLDHVLLLDDAHLGRLGRQYKDYFNLCRPHQGIAQKIPANENASPDASPDTAKPIEVKTVLGGLHLDYRRAA